jgi:potassium-transporting ATPase ATP-binding subunit
MEVVKMNKRMPVSAMLDPKIVVPAIGSSFVKLDPRLMIKNPVMFVVEVVAALTTVIFLKNVATGGADLGFTFQIIVWLWFTVLFANFAEAVAEGRGKAQAESLKKTRTESQAKLLTGSDKAYRMVSGTSLKVGDVVLVEAGDNIPSDGEVIEGVASVNEAAITGESAPVIRESGGDRSAVTGGTQVLSDWIRVRITAAQGSTFIDRMIKLVEGAERQKTPNEIALNILLAGLTIIFVFATVTIPSYAAYAGGSISVVVLVALFVTLIPTTIGALLSAIGIAGMDRLVRFNVLAMSGRAVESTPCCSTRPAPLPWAIARPPRSVRCAASPNRSLPMRRSWPPWPTKPRRDVRSWCWPRRSTGSAVATWPNSAQPSSPSRRRPG